MPKKRKLLEFMRSMLEQNACYGVEYINKEEGLFKIPWKHANCSNFNCEIDSQIFKFYAKFTNKYVEGVMDYEKWKTNLRSALYKSEDFIEHNDKHVSDGSNPYKVYSISIKNDTFISNFVGAEIPIPVLESSPYYVKSVEDQVVDPEVNFDDLILFDTKKFDLFSFVETDKNNETVSSLSNYHEDDCDININIFQLGYSMLHLNYKCPVLIEPDLSEDCSKSVTTCKIPINFDDGFDNTNRKKLYESMKHGIELFMDCDKLYCKRNCLARVFYSSGFQKLSKKIERDSPEVIFQLSNCQTDVSSKIHLTFGEKESKPKEPELKVEVYVWKALMMANCYDMRSLEISNSNSGPPLKKIKDDNFCN